MAVPNIWANMPSSFSVNANVLNTLRVLPGTPAYNAAKYVVQDPNSMVFSKGRIYDILPWGAAGVGAASYNFFTRSIGGTVTQEDTNMTQAANIGQGNIFIITRVSLDFISGLAPTTTGADAALVAANRVNDTRSVMERGTFNFLVNNINQILNGISPLMALPAPNGIMANGGMTTGNAAADVALTSGVWGVPFDITASPWSLTGGTNFNATVGFPAGALTLPSANAASKIGCYLDGWWLRPAG
ncbi:MAG: hypothetical protein V4563_17255 [Pseudomonadota bacterium]